MPLRARQMSRNKTLRHLRGEKHLSSVLVSNGYPFSFLQKLTKTGKPNNSAEPTDEFKATAVLPYVAIYITRDYIVKHTKILVFIVIYHDE